MLHAGIGDKMSIFELQPSSLPDGEFAAACFDNEDRLWADERLYKAASLVGEWRSPQFQLFRAERGVTDVLFNPNAIAVSPTVREELRHFRELEFLPIAVEGCGMFFLVHVTASVEVSPGFAIRRAPPPSGNIVEIYQFPVGYTPPATFFRVRQPMDSAAGRAGYCLNAIYATKAGARAVETTCSSYLKARALRGSS